MKITICRNLINEITIKHSDWMNLHVIIYIVHNQLDKDSSTCDKSCELRCNQNTALSVTDSEGVLIY